MISYLITYDLDRNSRNFPKIMKCLEDISEVWIQPRYGYRLILSEYSAVEIRKKIQRLLVQGDNLLIAEINFDNFSGWQKDED